MTGLSLTAFDGVALAIVGLSALFSVLRGMTKEALSIAVWGGASAVALYGFDTARAAGRSLIETEWLADAATLCIVFVVPLILFKILAATVANKVPRGTLGAVDSTAGAAFGVARGALIVSAAYLGLALSINPDNHPVWVTESALLPYVQDGANLLQQFLPAEYLDDGGPVLDQHKVLDALRGATGLTAQ